ncbi:DNA N-6-adenine-methyltransferase [Agrobacterium cavarae]|uniref:DNA N-6-adenine-methyltransferase n=1 Tax=Agrobacterium cavarae TaxID=2528239 RepID=UPI0028A743D9|nr:DNA N-6-adenine-methyltransferase [Agrobacterium cavarae]
MSYWETTGKSDEWYTPKHVFDALGCVFDLDVASPKEGGTFVPAQRYLSAGGLEASWGGFVWMNPPFGGRNGLFPWLNKFFRHGNGIALVPDRTSAPWFQEAWGLADMVLFTPKLRFLRPDGSEGKSPSNGTALFAVGNKGSMALERAALAKAGFLDVLFAINRRRAKKRHGNPRFFDGL